MKPSAENRAAAPSSGLRVVGRVLDILQAFTPLEPELTGTQLCHKLGLNKSTVHRLTGMIERRGFLKRDPATRAYSLGPAILGFTRLVLAQHDLGAVSRPHMQDLRDRTDETVTINIRVGMQRVCIAQVESRHELRMRLDIGNPIPLYCGAASKILLASMKPDQIEEYLRITKLRAMGPGSIRSVKVLRADLGKIRDNGYSMSREERIPGGITLAAPIRDASGEIVASLSVYGPIMRVTQERLTSWVPLVTETAKAISSGLGFVQ
jgi:DNA-binding IclR family transcriptional regulator